MWLKDIATNLLLWSGCINVIRAFWMSLEIQYYGAAVGSSEDTIICVLFATLLWWVVHKWFEVKEDE